MIEPWGMSKPYEKWSFRRNCNHCGKRLFPKPKTHPVCITLEQNVVLIECTHCGQDNEITDDPSHLNRELKRLARSSRPVAVDLKLGKGSMLHFTIGWPADSNSVFEKEDYKGSDWPELPWPNR